VQAETGYSAPSTVSDCIIQIFRYWSTAGRAYLSPLYLLIHQAYSHIPNLLHIYTFFTHRISTFYTHILLLFFFDSSFSNKHKPALATTATISFLRSFFTRAPSPATMSATKTKVQNIIDENPVAVFSKSYCPYCRQAKELLSQSGAKFFAIELDQVGM
jgi:thiol-disulfide isomerase/thioredoxin